jgi:G protein-coupled receptor GPR1
MLTWDSLIMLLIQSDMFKALWFMVYPIVTFSSGPVQSNSNFCQVNGFFLAWGIEASGGKHLPI